MTTQILLAVAGLVLLTVAADHLVLGSSRIAAGLRISPVVVGVVVIGLGTSAPEFLVSGVAAARGDTGLALGNITGSNILNLTLILGVASVIAKVPVASTVIRREVPLAVAAVALLAWPAWAGLTVITGLVLLAAAVGALWLLVRWAGQGRNAELIEETLEYVEGPANGVADAGTPAPDSARRPGTAWTEPVRALLGLAGVLAGAQLLVVNASSIATSLGVSPLIIGFTLLVMTVTAVVAWALLGRGLVLTRGEGAVLLGAYLATMPLLLSL